MLFSSIIFLFYFLPILTAVYFLVPRRRMDLRNLVLLIASLIFYSWGEPVYVFVMIYSSFFNYFMAHLIHQNQVKGGSGKKDLAFTVGMNLFILCFFKYSITRRWRCPLGSPSIPFRLCPISSMCTGAMLSPRAAS